MYINCESRFSEIIITYKSEYDLKFKGLKNSMYDATDWRLLSNYHKLSQTTLSSLTVIIFISLCITLHIYDHKYFREVQVHSTFPPTKN